MRIRPSLQRLILSSAAVFLSFASIALASSVSDEKIHQLEEMHHKAEEHILKNDFRGAIRIYQDIILEEPDDETAYTGMAQCHMVLGEFPRAKEAYLNALQINPENETAVLGLKKIADPDSMDFVEDQTVKVPAKEEDAGVPKPAKELNHDELVQTALKNAGFYKGLIDGIIGPATLNAVRDFQKIHGLPADGKVGPKTWTLLQPYLNNNTGP